jgi:type VI secretion system secreted protein VgrG
VSIALSSGGTRHIHGIVSRFRQLGTGAALANYQAEVVPWLWMLSLSADCRIFQNMSVPDIVTQVFSDLGYADFKLRLLEDHAPREYCVQYRETHLDFVSRLLEEEGIFYFFEHEAQRHVLVLCDDPAAIKPCDDLPTITAAPSQQAAARDDVYTKLVLEHAVHTRSVALSDYNYLTPSVSLEASIDAKHGMGELFDYPGGYEKKADGENYARLRLESVEGQKVTASGASTAPALTSGCKIDVAGRAAGGAQGAWLVQAVTHSARQGGFHGAGDTDEFKYENTFVLHPADVPWRPPRRTPRPDVRGTQSALVVGKAGEEIWTDAHGRVKLHFYWDRRGKRDENSSCWVRCSSAWAGRGYGQFSVPRIGQEVLVDFVDGNPDRPVIVGRVFNPEQPPPCDPGGSRGVVSGMRSKTHKGSGYNAMEMDDTAGKEKISIHAQYDMITTVGHDDTQTVKNHRTVTISEGNLKEDVVAGTATYHVKGAVDETFDATQSTKVNGDITIVSQTGGIAIAADAQHVYVKGTTSIQLHVGASTIWMDAGGQISIEGVNVTIKGSSSVTVKGGMVHSEADSQHQTKGAIVLSEGSATNTIKGGMVMLNP